MAIIFHGLKAILRKMGHIEVINFIVSCLHDHCGHSFMFRVSNRLYGDANGTFIRG